MEKTLSVSAIKDGTVIDHITQGSALIILRMLKLPRDQNRVTVGLNLTSRSMGFKDIIKIENCFLTGKEAGDVAVFAPEATLSIIRDYKVQAKIKADLPAVLENILICANPCCITRKEPAVTRFSVEEFKQKIFLRCGFCEKLFERSEIKDYKT